MYSRSFTQAQVICLLEVAYMAPLCKWKEYPAQIHVYGSSRRTVDILQLLILMMIAWAYFFA